VNQGPALFGYLVEQPWSQAVAKQERTELVNLSLEGHLQKTSGAGVNGDVEVSVSLVKVEYPHLRLEACPNRF